MTGTALAGLLKHVSFPLAAVVGVIGIYRDKPRYLAIGATAAAVIFTGIVYL